MSPLTEAAASDSYASHEVKNDKRHPEENKAMAVDAAFLDAVKDLGRKEGA